MSRLTYYYKLILNTLYEVSIELNSAPDIDNALKRVLQVLSSNLEVSNAMVLLHDESVDELVLRASLGISKDVGDTLRYKPGEGIVGKVFKQGTSMLIQDTSEEPQFLNKIHRKKGEVLSFIAVPITFNEQMLGVFAIDRRADSVYSNEADIDFLKMTSRLIASYISKVQAHELEKKKLREEKDRLYKEVYAKYTMEGLVGSSKAMREVIRKVEQVANTKTTVMIRGESGTGKEVVAKAIHFAGNRAKKPFIAVNCAAIPKELIESELFGHKKGSFTGANADKKGKFELATGGTIFLDEIGDMPYEAQSKLLRVLQDMKVEVLGSSKAVDVDVRVIAATNKNLEYEIKENNFRLDLYYRLNVMPIFLPPLRKRPEDIPALAVNALEKLNKNYGRQMQLTGRVIDTLTKCSWPGNIRELENCIERAMLSADGDIIDVKDVSCTRGDLCLSKDCKVHSKTAPSADAGTPQAYPQETAPPVMHTAEQTGAGKYQKLSDESGERERLISALESTGWVQAKAARMLGMTVRQINYRIQKYDIEVKKI